MNRLKTNTKEYRQRIEEYILECVSSEDEELTTLEEKINHFFFRFSGEFDFQNNKLRYPNRQQRIAEYLAGLPFQFDFMNYKILEVAKNLHKIETLTEKEEDKIIANWFNHLALHILRLKEKYNV